MVYLIYKARNYSEIDNTGSLKLFSSYPPIKLANNHDNMQNNVDLYFLMNVYSLFQLLLSMLLL